MSELVRAAIVGREEELASVAAVLDGQRHGLRAMVFEGPPGIGKTTVWRAGIEQARERAFTILEARPADAEATLGYTVLGDLLDSVFDEAVDQLPAPQRAALEIALLRGGPASARVDPRAIGLAVLGTLRHLVGTSPLTVAIDDLQWIDGPSAKVLAFALRRLRAEPVVLLVAERAEVEAPLDFASVVAAEALTRLALRPLDPSGLQQLFRERLGLTFTRSALRRVHETSGGNPFYAIELARALDAGGTEDTMTDHLRVPDGLASLLRRRLRSLSPEARAALLVVAALAEPTMRVVGGALGEAGGALDDAVREGVITIEGERIRFAHPLLASVVYGDSPPEERRRIHRALAGLVPTAEERAKHLALAAEEPDESVAEALDGAAGSAERRGAPDEAARLTEQAWRLTPPAEMESRRRRQVDAAAYHLAAGESARARELIERDVGSWPAGRARGKALLVLGRMTARGAVAKDLFERARLDAADDPALLAQAEGALVSYYFREFDPEGARPHARAKLAAATLLGEPAPRASALMDVAWAEFLLGHGLSPELLREAVELEESVPNPLGAPGLAARMREAMMLHLSAEFERARPLYRSLIERARADGSEPALCRCLALLSEVECLAGDYEPSAALASEAHLIALQAENEALRGLAVYRIALVEAHRGRVDAARAAVGEAVELGRRSSLHGRGAAAWAATFLELSLGNARAAVEASLPLADRFVGLGVMEPLTWGGFMPDLIEALVAVGDLPRAELYLDALDRRARATGRLWGLVTAARSRALIAAARGDLDEALAAADEAVAEGTRLAMPLERGRNMLVRGVVLRRAKQRRAARTSLEEATEVFDMLGAPLWVDRARAELGRIGGRRSSGDLTPTERQVALRAASGETNREIASVLFMSVKTVEANLSRVYRKLDVSSRRELARRLGPDVPREATTPQTTATTQS